MSNYRVVKLLKNRLYPTYQLHAVMANKKTAPQDGLRLAALATMDWLRLRLGENAPDEIKRMPEPSAYMETSDQCLISLHIHSGFVVDIVSLPEQGVWSLQITEPDLGSDPGNMSQERMAVPGRVIETDIAYKIVGSQLECGFQTVISDPEGTPEMAEVYRLAIVRQLIKHPDFGLRHMTKLSHDFARITTLQQIRSLQGILKNTENQLPCVVFTQVKEAPVQPDLSALLYEPSYKATDIPSLPHNFKIKASEAQDPPYDIARFAKNGVTYCRVYLLDDSLLEQFSKLMKVSLSPGDIAVFEPRVYGGKVWTLPFKPSKVRQDEAMTLLCEKMYRYPREKKVSFGHIAFLSAARESLLHSTADALQQSEEVAGEWAQRLTLLESNWKAELRKKNDEINALSGQLERQYQYQTRLEQEKEQLRRERELELAHYKNIVEEKEEDIAYLKRKLSQPKEHDQIASWVEEHFAGRLVMHPKAIALLKDKPARSISIDLICDALDFLATDYWDRRYRRISVGEMNNRCSEKYGRPFEVKPTGMTTIEFTPAQYKVKYFSGAMGKPVESPLDYHLGVGNDPESLLRIYFLHDDEKKLIVVGSLPRHLKTVSIQ